MIDLILFFALIFGVPFFLFYWEEIKISIVTLFNAICCAWSGHDWSPTVSKGVINIRQTCKRCGKWRRL